MIVARPQPGEYAGPMQGGYIARVKGEIDPLPALEAQRDQFVAQLRPLSDDSAAHRYAPGKWTIKQLVGHLTDAERIFAYRLLRIARGDQTPLPGFEENDYAAAGGSDARSIADLIDEWTSVRAATLTLVRSIDGDGWNRRGTASNAPISARALVYLILGHTDHHRGILEERYGVMPARG
jgi:uncharacterized damage-inducible protein DinB